MNEVQLWPCRKLFEYGMVYCHPKITFTNAERIIKYSLSKENWPMLSWKVWRHMACEKLGMAEQLAWVYFETFDSFQEVSENEAKSILDKRAALSLTDFKATRHVNTLQFTLFLYAQTIVKVQSLNKSINEMCPWKQITSPHAEWILNNLDQIFKLCSYNATSKGTISLNGVRGLEFLIRGRVDGNILPFSRLLARFEDEMIYNRETKHCSTSKLKNFITSHINGCPVSAPQGATTRLVDKPARLIGNHSIVTESEDREFYLKRMVDQTACLNDKILEDSCIRISKCENSTLYLIGNIKSVSISQCNNCTIVAPSVSGIVRLTKSSNISLVTYSRCLFISTTSDSTIYSSVPTNPVLVSCSGIKLAPLNVNHSRLADDVKKAALPTFPNLWDSPLDLTVRRSSVLVEEIFQKLDPKEFFYINIPFDLESSSKPQNPAPRVAKFFVDLPEEYAQAVANQEKVQRNGRKLTKNPQLTAEMKQNLKSFTNKLFMDWLNETGGQLKLEELYKLDPMSPKKKVV